MTLTRWTFTRIWSHAFLKCQFLKRIKCTCETIFEKCFGCTSMSMWCVSQCTFLKYIKCACRRFLLDGSEMHIQCVSDIYYSSYTKIVYLYWWTLQSKHCLVPNKIGTYQASDELHSATNDSTILYYKHTLLHMEKIHSFLPLKQ